MAFLQSLPPGAEVMTADIRRKLFDDEDWNNSTYFIWTSEFCASIMLIRFDVNSLPREDRSIRITPKLNDVQQKMQTLQILIEEQRRATL